MANLVSSSRVPRASDASNAGMWQLPGCTAQATHREGCREVQRGSLRVTTGWELHCKGNTALKWNEQRWCCYSGDRGGAARTPGGVLCLPLPFWYSVGLPRLQRHLGSCMCFALQLTSSSETLNRHTDPLLLDTANGHCFRNSPGKPNKNAVFNEASSLPSP